MKKTKKVKVITKIKKIKKIKKEYTGTVHVDAKQPQDSEYWRTRPTNDTQRDWDYGGENWVHDYTLSREHPHRQKIIELLRTFPWSYLLEVGCSTGPNLQLIREAFPDQALFGIDIHPESVATAQVSIDRTVNVQLAEVSSLPFKDLLFDVVIADAVLMYIKPNEIEVVMDELARVTQKAILIVDRFSDSDSVTGHVWGRNYTQLLCDRGYAVTEFPVTEALWPTSKNWQKYGRYFLGLK